MPRRGKGVRARGRNPARGGQEARQTQSVGRGGQAWPKAIVANSPAGTAAMMREQQHQLEKRLLEMEGEAATYRQRAEEYGQNLKWLTDQLNELRLAAEAQANTLEEKETALVLAQSLNGGMKRAVAGLRKEIADSTAWAHEPLRGADALANLLAGGDTAGRPTYVGTRVQWSPGDLRDIHMWKKAGACACMREFAANALSHPHRRFEDTAILAHGGFGVIRRGKCKKTKKVYAIKTLKPGCKGNDMMQELLAYSIIDAHKNIVSIYALSDVAGSEGIIMELAVCDLFAASTGKSDLAFTLDQILSFEADGTEGLSYMHGKGVIHCDVKLDNTLVCRGNGPGGFVGKLADPGLWCGLGERRAAKTGTLGRVPVENILGDVLAAPNQDAFAAGSDSCFLVIHPDMKTGGANMWTYWSLTTEEERQRLIARSAEGGEVDSIRADITLRTMSDGTLARVLLQPEMLNPALPASELTNVCQVLRRMVSRDPAERLNMPVFTSFLRRLAAKTAAALVAPLPETDMPSVIGHPPVSEHQSGIDSEIVPQPVISLPPSEGAVIVDDAYGGQGLIPSADSARGGDSLAPAPVLAPHADGDPDGAAAAVPLAEAFETESDPTRSAMESEPANVALAVLPPVVAPHLGGNLDDAAAAVPMAEAFEVGHESAPPAVDPRAEAGALNVATPLVEEIAPGLLSMERGNLAPPPVVVPHEEGDGRSVPAAVPPAEAIEVGSGSTMHGLASPVVNFPAEAEPTDAADVSLEDVGRRVNPFLRPFPRSPAEVMATFVAGTLHTQITPLGMSIVPLPIAAEPLEGQAYCGGGDSGGGGKVFGEGRVQESRGRRRGWLAGLARR